MKTLPPALLAVTIVSGILMTAGAGAGVWLLRRPAPPPPDATAALMRSVDGELAARQWEQALRRLDALAPVFAQRDRAQRELRNRARYERFCAADGNHDWESAMAEYGELDQDSVYRADAQPRFTAVRAAFIAQHLDGAGRAFDAGKWETARRHVEAVLTVDPHDADALELARSLNAADPARAPPSTPLGCERTLIEAQDAYVHGHYQPSIALSRQCVALAPTRAWRVIGAASCFLKDRAQSAEAMAHLDRQGQQFLRYVCERNGITLR